MFKTINKRLLTFIITAFLLVFILTLINLIPQSSIKENTERSTTYLQDNKGFSVLFNKLENTRMDNYADCMTVNVIYNVDSKKPFYSLIADNYYRIDGNEASDDLANSVFNGKETQNNYSRYWHGMQIFLRPLLLFCQLSTARIIISCVVLLLNILLCIILWKKKYKAIMLLYIISALSIDIWMCAFSLEYVSIFLVVGVILLAVAYTDGCNMDTLLIISGAAACFFDFLTTETLTFTMPVLMYLLIKNHKNEIIRWKTEIKRIIILGIEWLLAYAGMFLLKWGLVYIICGKDSFMTALSSAAVRINGLVPDKDISYGTRLLIDLLRNIGCMLHVSGEVTTSRILFRGLIILFILFAIFYIFYKKKHNKELIAILLLIGLIPYARYLALSNHSYMHFFFTYRAQMATVFAVLSILYIATDFTQFRKNRKKK